MTRFGGEPRAPRLSETSPPNNNVAELALPTDVSLPPFESIECHASSPGVKLQFGGILPEFLLENSRIADSLVEDSARSGGAIFGQDHDGGSRGWR